jgi:hypothetical protein
MNTHVCLLVCSEAIILQNIAYALLLLLAVCIGNPAQPDNGSFACPSPALPGSVCNATCDVGYAGAPSSTCQPNGTYRDVTGSCKLIGE